jgi:hypothetical protein
MVGLRKSVLGASAAGVFLGAAIGIETWLLYSAYADPADSGEGGLLLLPFMLPWLMLVPDWALRAAWFDAVGPGLAWGMIFVNAFLLYCLAGGLRWKARAATGSQARDRDLGDA